MKSKTFAVATALSVGMATNAFAQSVGSQFSPPNLSGLYRCVRYCAGVHFPHVTAYGWQLAIADQAGEAIRAWIDWPGHIRLPALNETAVYCPDGFTIQFSRRPVWILVDPEQYPDQFAIITGELEPASSLPVRAHPREACGAPMARIPVQRQ